MKKINKRQLRIISFCELNGGGVRKRLVNEKKKKNYPQRKNAGRRIPSSKVVRVFGAHGTLSVGSRLLNIHDPDTVHEGILSLLSDFFFDKINALKFLLNFLKIPEPNLGLVFEKSLRIT